MGDVNKDKVKAALDNFENDEYVQSKEKLKGEFRKKFNDYLKKELDTENDPIDNVETEDNESEDDDN